MKLKCIKAPNCVFIKVNHMYDVIYIESARNYNCGPHFNGYKLNIEGKPYVYPEDHFQLRILNSNIKIL